METILENKEEKKVSKNPKVVATLTVIQTANGEIKISMFPEDKKLLKKMVFLAFADKDFKEIIFDATIAETQAVMKQMGIEPDSPDLQPPEIINPKGLIYPKRH